MQTMPLLERAYPGHFLFREHPLFRQDAHFNMYQEEDDSALWTAWAALVTETHDSVLEHKKRLEFSASYPPWYPDEGLAARARAIGATWATEKADGCEIADPVKVQAGKRQV